MFQKKFRYMAAVLAALVITQGSIPAFADEIGPGYEDQNKASTDTSTSDPTTAWKKVNGVYVDSNGVNMDGALLRGISVSKWQGDIGQRPLRMMFHLRISAWDPSAMRDSIPWMNIMKKI